MPERRCHRLLPVPVGCAEAPCSLHLLIHTDFSTQVASILCLAWSNKIYQLVLLSVGAWLTLGSVYWPVLLTMPRTSRPRCAVVAALLRPLHCGHRVREEKSAGRVPGAVDVYDTGVAGSAKGMTEQTRLACWDDIRSLATPLNVQIHNWLASQGMRV